MTTFDNTFYKEILSEKKHYLVLILIPAHFKVVIERQQLSLFRYSEAQIKSTNFIPENKIKETF